MKERIGFVCIGQAGGNIGQLFEQRGFNCLFINTSTEDLDTINSGAIVHIPGAKGCNHNRDKAVQLVKSNYKMIIEEVMNRFEHEELIYLVFSTGGGTGSGMSPILIELLGSTIQSKNFGAITILPDDEESVKSHINAIKSYEELSKAKRLASVFTLDNSKGDRLQINERFVQLFDKALEVNTKTHVLGNIDEAELWEMLNTRGNATISVVKSREEITTADVIKSWRQGVFADMERDKKLVYLGFSGPEDIQNGDLIRVSGKPWDVFRGYNEEEAISILAGLSFPKTRLDDLVKSVELNLDSAKSSITNAKTNTIDSLLDFLDGSEKERISSLAPEINLDSLDEILKKYE